MTPTQMAENTYEMYAKGYSYLINDNVKVRELAMRCAVESTQRYLETNREYYAPILDELYTMCEYMNIKK